MLIGGLQKLSLIDYPDKVAAVVFTKGCLFRCPFCHNPDLVLHEREVPDLFEETKEYLKKHHEFLDGVCITGGEPTIHKDLPEFIDFVKGLGLSVKLDTNGVTPKMVEKFLKEKSIDYVAMDIKHTWDKYDSIANLAPDKKDFVARCKETFRMVQDSGIAHEWRTTVLPGYHTDDDFLEMASQMKPGESYYIQDISYAVTLNQGLDNTKPSDAKGIASKLRVKYPGLFVGTR